MVWLSGLLPYAQAEAVLKRIGKHRISDSSLWRTVAQQSQRLLTEPDPIEQPSWPEDQWLCGKALSMDGGRVHLRQEGWKELKVGLVGTVVTTDPPESGIVPEVHTVQMRYTAVLGGVEPFSAALVHTAQTQAFFEAAQSSITADGAAWIGGVADPYFPQSVQIVDGYHARQHLAAAAQACFPDQTETAAAWLQAHTELLYEGQIEPLLAELSCAGLRESVPYFLTHQAHMRYRDFQEACFPIGSGSVEAEVKQFKQRLAAPGMHWSRPGAERMLPVRAAVLDGSFDARWSQAA